MPNQPNNRTVKALLARTEKAPAQLLDRTQMNELFAGALMAGLSEYDDVLEFEYTTEGVPESGKAISSMFQGAVWGHNTFKVFNGSNDADLLWFSPQVNLAYRALHDLDHAEQYEKGRGTTKMADELYLNCLMAKRVYKYAIEQGYKESEALLAFFCVYHDTVGQVYYYKEHNDFCVDQRANTEMLIQHCAGVNALKDGGVVLARLIMIQHMMTCDVSWYDV